MFERVGQTIKIIKIGEVDRVKAFLAEREVRVVGALPVLEVM